MNRDLTDRIFNISGLTDFQNKTLEIFRFQAENNQIYRDFIKLLNIDPSDVTSTEDIPFLPAGIFKSHKIISGPDEALMIFESSGTSGNMTSRHYITNPGIYEMSFLKGFSLFYGDPADYFIAALLPSYSERENSSLIYMVKGLIKRSRVPCSGFYTKNINELLQNIEKSLSERRKVILIGVSFALLDLAEKYSPDLSGIIVMETGGMKGRRKEMTRQELHTVLRKELNVDNIHSEYGMTELLSQAYSKRDGLFFCPPWMKIIIRDPLDPLSIFHDYQKTGGINIIDLANINSCSFIATDDLGKLHPDGSFEVLGRFDSSDIRGCNLLFEG